ncbi:peptidylprolyl isomerase [bacterium]|nr:peptidylprolyl isomerase [bacterium]
MKKIIFCLVISILVQNAVFAEDEFQSIELNPIRSLKLEPVKYVSAGHILVESYDEAIELKKRIDNGESFEKLARKYSQCPSSQRGGALGMFGRGQMVKPFENAAFNLKIGEVSEPVKTDFGWHLIKVYNRK